MMLPLSMGTLTESYVTDCAEIVVYYWWAAQTALSAYWDTMGVAWVVRDSSWNASCASAQRQKQLVGSSAERTLEASSIDMSFAPPLIVAHVKVDITREAGFSFTGGGGGR